MVKKTIGDFLGASISRSEELVIVAQELGQQIAQRGLTLVYGGANGGLMGVLANAVLTHHGKVIGVISNDLPNEVTHPGLSTLHRVETINERKEMLIKLSSGLLTIPGGLGTIEELAQAWNAVKIGSHQKFLGLLNTNGYYNDLLAFFDRAVDMNLMQTQHRNLLVVDDQVGSILDRFQQYCCVV